MWAVMRMYDDHVEKVWICDDDTVHQTALAVVHEHGQSSFDDAPWMACSNSFENDMDELDKGFHEYSLEDLLRYNDEYWVTDDEGTGVIVMRAEVVGEVV